MNCSSTIWIGSFHCPRPASADWVDQVGSQLPVSWLSRIHNYTCLSDKVLSIGGKWLLREGLGRMGIAADQIGELHYPPGCRPVLVDHPTVRFSIAHSNEWAVCVVGLDVEVGIDIEIQKSRALGPLCRFFAPAEWEQIELSPDPLSLFYRYWVSKEAIIKAANSVSIDRFDTIDTSGLTPISNSQRWYLTPIMIHPSYTCWLSSNKPVLI